MTFYGKSRMDPEVEHHVHESPPVMTVPLLILAALSVVGGLVGVPLIPGWNRIHDFLAPVVAGHAVEVAQKAYAGLAFASEGAAAAEPLVHHSAGLELLMMGVSVAIGLAGIITAYYLYIRRPELPDIIAARFKGYYHLLINKYFVDEFYDALVVSPLKSIATFLWKGLDEGVVDGALVNGSAALVRKASGLLKYVQTGLVQSYALSILFGLAVILYVIMK
jgi:NADH-quinone oxidoreductase subunit L